MTQTSKGRTIPLSTPYGQRGFFCANCATTLLSGSGSMFPGTSARASPPRTWPRNAVMSATPGSRVETPTRPLPRLGSPIDAWPVSPLPKLEEDRVPARGGTARNACHPGEAAPWNMIACITAIVSRALAGSRWAPSISFLPTLPSISVTSTTTTTTAQAAEAYLAWSKRGTGGGARPQARRHVLAGHR